MDQLLDIEAVAEELGVAESTLANWRHRRVGPAFVKLGNKVRYRRSDLEAWLQRQRVETCIPAA